MILFVLAAENILFPLVGAAIVLKFALSRRRSLLKDLPAEMAERLGFIPLSILTKLAGRETIWIHAASAGEVAAVSELIARIKARGGERARSEERRVGKECRCTCRSRWSPYH